MLERYSIDQFKLEPRSRSRQQTDCPNCNLVNMYTGSDSRAGESGARAKASATLPTQSNFNLAATCSLLIAIGSAIVIMQLQHQEFGCDLDLAGAIKTRSNLVALTLNGYVKDMLLFVAASQLVSDSHSQEKLEGLQQANTSHGNRAQDQLPAVSFGGGVAKLKRLVNGGTKTKQDIPSYPLDEQPDPERITHLDADLRSCLGPARAQLGCGACYAFSWNSLLEWHYCMQSGGQAKPDFSEQHIVDCSQFGGHEGCNAGKIEDVKMFAEHFGYQLEQDYPYTAKYRPQSFDRCAGSRHFRVIDWTRIVVDRAEWERVLREQPILVQAHLPSDITRYRGGIHPAQNCNERLLHGMLLVGFGREAGQPYWLVRNSMGEKWGEFGGHFRLARDDSSMKQCFATGWVGKFKFDSIDGDKYEEFYERHIEFEPTEHKLAPTKKRLTG